MLKNKYIWLKIEKKKSWMDHFFYIFYQKTYRVYFMITKQINTYITRQ